MAFVIADRVQETTTSTGTGTITLAGASTGFQSFSAIGNGNNTYYTIAGRTTSEWEVGIGTYTASGTTLSRDTVLSSSNSGSLVNFSAGTKDVFVTPPASRSALVQSAGSGLFAGTTAFTANGALYASSTTVVTSGTLPVASGGTNATATPTAGAIAYGTGTAYAFTTAGTSGQVLTSAAASAPTWTTATDANTASAIVKRDASGNFSAGTITAALTGTASNNLALSGGTMTGLIIGASSASTNVNTANDAGSLSVRGSNTTVAVMSFHRVSAYAINMGLGTDNVFRIGGWSASNDCLKMDGSGNLTMLANVTAYSDERKKSDWASLPENFVDKLSCVKSGKYTRTDINERQVGISAQSLRELLPEAVMEDGDGYLSVAYGNAALAACVELAKEVVALRARVAALEAKGN